jgi:hypothetical protein
MTEGVLLAAKWLPEPTQQGQKVYRRPGGHGQPWLVQSSGREAIEVVGATALFLPPYHPDLNPIEAAFAKLKSTLRAKVIHTVEALWSALGSLFDDFNQHKCVSMSAIPVISSQRKLALERWQVKLGRHFE